LAAKDHYQLLGVERTATRRTIRAAYRKALLLHHPDANAGNRDGEQVLLQVITAGRVLCNQKLRSHYDQQLNKSSSQTLQQSLPRKTPLRPAHQTLFLHCKKIIRGSRRIFVKFFSAEQAKAANLRAAQKRKRNSPEFTFYLQQAIGRKNSCSYDRGEDGIYRKRGPQPSQSKVQNWRKRTAVWLLIGILLLRV
jgi:DnaJ-class molecular chaperone